MNKNRYWLDIGKESRAIEKANKMIEKREAKKFDRWVKKQEKEWKKSDKKNWL